jgi:catechol 2,3-dioxygenase-like lactoylglutathione lyase family enzyme
MRRTIGALIISTAVVMLFSMLRTMAVSASDLSAVRVNHVGVVVPDVEAALRQYVRVMGFAVPKVSTLPVPMPDGRRAEIKLATLQMPNFHIELVQPLNNQGPYYDHFQAHGMSIQHMGLPISEVGRIDDLRAGLEQNGATTPLAPPGDALPALATLPVSHVGFAAVNTSAAAGTIGKILGTTPPSVRDYKDAQYPPNTAWNRNAYLRLAFWNQGGMGLEVIESVGGPTPWSEYVQRQKGTAVQHIAINVGNWMDETIRDLVTKGGKWSNGKPGGNYAYVDFMDTLGLIVELNGTSKTSPAK